MKKLFREFKCWLIHKLGGYTEYDYRKEFVRGKANSYSTILKYMQDLYGTPADEFCENVYKFVNKYSIIFNNLLETGRYSK